MLDIHYELRCKGGNDEITDVIKNSHKKLTERVRAIIEQYITMSNERFGIDWRNATMTDVGKMFEFVASVINREFKFFRTVVSPTVVYGPRFSYGKRTIGLIAGNQTIHFNILDDDSYNQFTLISDVVYCDKDANSISISRLSTIECPNLAPCMPYSNPDSILVDSDVPELMENDSNSSSTSSNLYPVFGSDTPPGFGIPESRRDGARLINHAHDIEYTFDAPLAPID